MKQVFVDTAFWIARVNRRDNLHQIARLLGDACVNHPLVTTDAVLGELGTFFAEKGPELRQMVAEYIMELENDPNLTVLPDTRDIVKKARQLYAARPDKGYSTVDCNSMIVMRERSIQLVLTSDEHFEQEGFIALMRKDVKNAAAFLM